MTTPGTPQGSGTVRPNQTPRLQNYAYRPPQRLLTGADAEAPILREESPAARVVVTARKRTVKQENDDGPILAKQKYSGDRPRRPNMPTLKVREAGASTAFEAASSNYERMYDEWEEEMSGEEQDYYEEYYDQLPPMHRDSNGRFTASPKRKRPTTHSNSIISIGKAVVSGKKEMGGGGGMIDVQQMIEKFVNAESQRESEAWLVNIGLCEKLNCLTRDMEKLQSQVHELMLTRPLRSNMGRERNMEREMDNSYRGQRQLTLSSPWPGEAGGHHSPSPFGLNPAPDPPTSRAFIIPALYCKEEVNCSDVYTALQRTGRKRPGVVFLTYFMRDLFNVAIEAPHKYTLTIRSKVIQNGLKNMAVEFIKPIEEFFLCACDFPNGSYTLCNMLKEAICNELRSCRRELRRAPRKEKNASDERNMMRVLKGFEERNQSILDDEGGIHHEEEVVEVEEEGEKEEVIDEEEDYVEEEEIHN